MPATLVEAVIYAILAALIAVGGYMVVWAIVDSRWKGRTEQKLDSIEDTVETLEKRTENLPKWENQIEVNTQRLAVLEQKRNRNT